MDNTIGGDHAVTFHEIGVTGIVGDASFCLHHNQRTSHIVPLSDITLGIGIQPACCHIA